MKYRRTSAYHPIQIPLGLVIWSLWFVALYGGLSVACSVAPPPADDGAWNWLNLALGGLTLATLLALLWLARRFCRMTAPGHGLNERQVFVTRMAAGMHFIAALATLFVGIPLLQLPPCV